MSVHLIKSNLEQKTLKFYLLLANSALGQDDYAVVMVHSYSGFFLPSVITTNTFNYWEAFGF